MLEIEQKLIEIEKSILEQVENNWWQLKDCQVICDEAYIDKEGKFHDEVEKDEDFYPERALKEATRKTLLQTTKECAENELEHLDYVIREINIDNITLENVIHTRIMNLKQTIDFIDCQQIQNGSNKHDITTFDESKRVTIGKPTRPNDKTADNKIKKQEKA